MSAVAARKPHYEDVPPDVVSAFTFREFRWPSFPFNWHYHPELELTLIVAGSGLRFVGDAVEEFRDGDLCLLGADTPHCWASHANAPSGVASLVIQFQPDSWGPAFWSLPELRAVRDLFARARRGLAIQSATRQVVARTILDMPHQPHGAWERLSMLITILVRIAESSDCRPLATSGYEMPARAAANKKLGQILGFIHAHLDQDLRQRDAARAAGMSVQSFSHFFRRCVGKTYVAYVNGLKVSTVCRLLLETDQSITEAAYAASFNNLSHFNAQFRRLKGMTPRQFRQHAKDVTPGEFQSPSDWLGRLA
ncbi:MAG: AraC family transcriptional regulator [Verrucomicrobiota bacterium]